MRRPSPPQLSSRRSGRSASSLSCLAAAAQSVSILSERAAPLFYLALVTTATAQWLQTIGQSRVNAQDAAVIYALDPVYAAGFSWLLLGEQLGPQGYAGVAVVLGAVFLSRAPRAAAGYAEESEAKGD